MSRQALVERAQVAAELGMVDTCTIRRVTGRTWDPETGVESPAYLTPNPYEGKCRVQARVDAAAQDEVGEDAIRLLRLEVQLPMSVTGLKVDDEVAITASADPDLVGRVFLIRDLFHKTHASSRRVGVTERTGS